MMRVAMMNRLFIETDDGNHVSHSAATRILHTEPGAMDSAGFLLEEMTVSSSHNNAQASQPS